jgi:catechol 2,3-dioxygenase-like lactoylglutathione lyase family enzyme
VWFACGDAHQLHVGVEEPFAPARKAHPALLVDDLDALAARLRDAGIDVVWDDAIPGVRRFYAADPFGNRVELTGG